MCMLQSEILEVEYLFDARDYSRPGQDGRGSCPCPCTLIGKGDEVVSVL